MTKINILAGIGIVLGVVGIVLSIVSYSISHNKRNKTEPTITEPSVTTEDKKDIKLKIYMPKRDEWFDTFEKVSFYTSSGEVYWSVFWDGKITEGKGYVIDETLTESYLEYWSAPADKDKITLHLTKIDYSIMLEEL